MSAIRSLDLETQTERLHRLEAENRALQEQLRTAEQQGELRHRLARLEAENRALTEQLLRTQRLAALGTMTAMVAHEFNNILTPVISYAQLACKNPAMREKAVARAADGGQRACDICRAILGLAGDDPAEAVEVELSQIIAETIMAMARDPKRDQIEITLRAPADLKMTTRKVELQQVLLNLLLNARTAVMSHSGPRRIDMVAEGSGDRVILRVQDNGVGIPPENHKRIFEPFFTTRRASEGGAGHGLGLAICKEIVRSLGGEINVESTPGFGSTFTVVLPRQSLSLRAG